MHVSKTHKNFTNFYRFSFQNQESDNEIKGVGNSINYKYRMHDPRIGRFFAVDPLAPDYPWNSPYSFSENIVINAVELEGLEKKNIYIYDPKTKSFPKTPNHKEVDQSLEKNVNIYIYAYPKGGVKRTVVKSWDGEVVVKSEGNFDHGLLKANLNEPRASVDKGADKTHYDSWEGGAEAGNEDHSFSGEKGLKEKGIPLIVGTVATVFSGGTLATASTGYAITWGTAGLVANGDELTRFFSSGSQTLLENLAQSIGGEKGIETLKGAKLGISVRSASNAFVNLTVLLADGKTYSGVYDLTKNIFTLGKTGTKITQTATSDTKKE